MEGVGVVGVKKLPSRDLVLQLKERGGKDILCHHYKDYMVYNGVLMIYIIVVDKDDGSSYVK